MNKFVKVSVTIFVVLIVVSVFLFIKLFYIGNSNYNNIVVDKVSKGNIVEVNGHIIDSRRAFKDFSYYLENNLLYIKINSVLVSNKYKEGSFNIKIKEDGFNIDDIYLTDGKNVVLIN